MFGYVFRHRWLINIKEKILTTSFPAQDPLPSAVYISSTPLRFCVLPFLDRIFFVAFIWLPFPACHYVLTKGCVSLPWCPSSTSVTSLRGSPAREFHRQRVQSFVPNKLLYTDLHTSSYVFCSHVQLNQVFSFT